MKINYKKNFAWNNLLFEFLGKETLREPRKLLNPTTVRNTDLPGSTGVVEKDQWVYFTPVNPSVSFTFDDPSPNPTEIPSPDLLDVYINKYDPKIPNDKYDPKIPNDKYDPKIPNDKGLEAKITQINNVVTNWNISGFTKEPN